jgi:hypothetical protein
MKTRSIALGAAAWVALFLAGCETTGRISARTQEKSAVYSKLQRWEKMYIDRGLVAVGFTPDMVYMAVGRPTKAEPRDLSGVQSELWIYKHFFPTPDANYARFGNGSAEPVNPPAPARVAPAENPAAAKASRGMGTASMDHPSNFATGGPQGGSMEPSDLQSYTLYVLFEDGKATKVGINPE